MSDSIWSDGGRIQMPQYEKLTRIKKVDVTIVGGGLCGLLCAYFLKEAGVECLLLEGSRIASGTVRHAMAQVTSQHGLIYSRLLETLGEEKARMYFEANELALHKYRELAASIDCDFEERSSYIYSRTDREYIEREVRAASLLGMKAEFCETPELPFDTVGAVRFPNQAQMNPVKFLYGLVKDIEKSDKVTIFEEMPVDDWINGTTWSGLYITIPKNIICTTHFPFYKKAGGYNNKLYQNRSYIMALDHVPELHGMYADASDNGLALRGYKDMIFVGGATHRVGQEERDWNEFREKILSYYPEAIEREHWEVEDCVSLDGIPYIGPYSDKTPNMYVATGFNGWGMTSAMTAAILLTDAIINGQKANGATESYPWGEVFYPERKIVRSQYFANVKENVRENIKSFLTRKSKIND